MSLGLVRRLWTVGECVVCVCVGGGVGGGQWPSLTLTLFLFFCTQFE